MERIRGLGWAGQLPKKEISSIVSLSTTMFSKWCASVRGFLVIVR